MRSEPRTTRICPTCQGRERRRPSVDLLGQVLDGRFLVEGLLGDGGMGTIYRARHLLLDKPVAIKVLRHGGDDTARRRFLLEARAASSLHHSNIIDISDYGTLPGGPPFLVMELLEGPTLAQAIAGGPLPPRRACLIGAQIARALQAVHDKGIVHRDLKPENVLLIDSEGRRDFVKVVDFGIAKVARGAEERRGPADGDGPLTCEGLIIGTPEYMAPEQIVGGDVDHRADQYALGCLLYEMLTGVLPFNHPEPQPLLRKHVLEPVIPLRERRPALPIPASLEDVVLRAMEKDREDRFPTMRSLERALLREAAGLASRPTELMAASRASRPTKLMAARPELRHRRSRAARALLRAEPLSFAAGVATVALCAWLLLPRLQPAPSMSSYPLTSRASASAARSAAASTAAAAPAAPADPPTAAPTAPSPKATPTTLAASAPALPRR